MRKAVNAVRNNFRAFERENEKPLSDAEKNLSQLVKHFGDLNEAEKAAAVEHLKTNLKATVLERAGAIDLPATPTGLDSLTTQAPAPQVTTVPLLQKLQGRWSHPGYHLRY
ncbi:MAG: hypothetical protein ACKOTB_12900, partial [Planctomycetia bacterium]